MGKNKRKRSLNVSSSSSNLGDTSLGKNSSQEEKMDVQQNSDTRKNDQTIMSTDTSFKVNLTEIAETTTGDGDKMESMKSTEDVRNFISNSSVNLRSDKIAQDFETYFETLARRRSQSLENRSSQVIDTKLPKQLVREDFLKVVPHKEILGQQFGLNDKVDKHHHHLAHPKKKLRRIYLKVQCFITFSRLLLRNLLHI